MGIFDEIGKALKKVEDEVKRSGPDAQFNDPGNGSSNGTLRRPHPGYSRITAWVRTRYRGRISGVADPYQQRLGLEQISAEATAGLSPKARKGFLDYLKSRNYEQLLK